MTDMATQVSRLLRNCSSRLIRQQQYRLRSTKLNTVVVFVPQQEAWIIERMGRFHRTLNPGLNFLLPVLDSIKYLQSLKELAIEIPQQSAITVDNVAIQIDGVLYLRVVDPYQASYGVEDPEFAIVQLAQTTMRSEVGKISLDTVFRERELLNESIVEVLNKAAEPWGIRCMRYEIKNMKMPPRIEEAMQMQVEAERKKRASILESEGQKMAEINVAEGKKASTILASEAIMQEKINQAQGEAQAMQLKANARAKAINVVSEALNSNHGINAATLSVAEQYITAFGNLAKTTNTVILPANTGDATSMVTQAVAVYKSLTNQDDKQKFFEISDEEKSKQTGQTDDNPPSARLLKLRKK